MGLYLVASSSGVILGQISVRLFSVITENQEMLADMKLYINSFLAFIGFVFIVKAKDIASHIKETT